jgi:hypothetical protein
MIKLFTKSNNYQPKLHTGKFNDNMSFFEKFKLSNLLFYKNNKIYNEEVLYTIEDSSADKNDDEYSSFEEENTCELVIDNDLDYNILNTCKINDVNINTFIKVMDDCYFLNFYLNKLDLSTHTPQFYNIVTDFKHFISLLINSLEIISTYSNIINCKKEIISFIKYNYTFYKILYKRIIKKIDLNNEKLINFNYNEFTININQLIEYYKFCKYTNNYSFRSLKH